MSAEGIRIARRGCAGRITFARPKALNALSHEMCLAIAAALETWEADPEVAMLVIDAEGERAFCAGGDIAQMYHQARAGDLESGRKFWRDEYRMNARIAGFSKPVVALMQGYVMGGGVGVGGHASHRVVGDSTQVAMPECSVGLVPDVGGSLLLARAPGRLGEYLGVTGARMGPGEAIHAGFADFYLPEPFWPALIARLEETGDHELVAAAAQPAPESALAAQQDRIDRIFAGDTIADILHALRADDSEFAREALAAIARNSPLSMACTVEMVRHARAAGEIRAALEMEYRFTHRAMERGDFLEGIRAAVIDKDRAPKWKHEPGRRLPAEEVDAMLAPLGDEGLTFLEETA